VIDADGSPVAGARVMITASSIPVPEIALLTNDDGRFSIRLPSGQYTFQAYGSGGAMGQTDLQATPDLDEFVIQLGR
jgi:hypothetical protein